MLHQKQTISQWNCIPARLLPHPCPNRGAVRKDPCASDRPFLTSPLWGGHYRGLATLRLRGTLTLRPKGFTGRVLLGHRWILFVLILFLLPLLQP